MVDVREQVWSAGLTLREVATRVDREEAHVHRVLSGKLRCSAELCPLIEEATGGAVSKSVLRPDLWPPLITGEAS